MIVNSAPCACRVVRLQISDDLAGVVLGDVCAEGFVHFVDFGFPCHWRKWRLHGYVSGTVAGVAVDANFLKAITWSEVDGGHRIS